jgi:hypothetical protein
MPTAGRNVILASGIPLKIMTENFYNPYVFFGMLLKIHLLFQLFISGFCGKYR